MVKFHLLKFIIIWMCNGTLLIAINNYLALLVMSLYMWYMWNAFFPCSISAAGSSCQLVIIMQCQKFIFSSEVLIEAGYSIPDWAKNNIKRNIYKNDLKFYYLIIFFYAQNWWKLKLDWTAGSISHTPQLLLTFFRNKLPQVCFKSE